MFNREKYRAVIRGTAALLGLVLFSGCATQQVLFPSIPPGATVVAGEKRGITPCTLRVSEKLEQVVFRLPSGEEMTLPLTGLDSDLEEATEVSGKVLGVTLKVVGGVVALLGAGIVVFGASDTDDDGDLYGHEEDDGSDWDVMGFGLVVALGGILVFGLGEWIS